MLQKWYKQNECLHTLQLKLLRADWVRHAGGVAIYIKYNIKTKFICKSPKDSESEYLFVELFDTEDKILIGAVYRLHRLLGIIPITFISRISVMYNNVVILNLFNEYVPLTLVTPKKVDYGLCIMYEWPRSCIS